MAASPKSIRPAPILEEAIANNGGATGLSHRLAQIGDRYLEILRRTAIPDFSDAEMKAMRDCSNGTWLEPAASIRGALWLAVEDSIPDGIGKKWGINAPELVEKLRRLDYVQEIKLIESIEGWWAQNRVDERQ